MSVDYYGCDHCGQSRYSEFVKWCDNCNRMICTKCVINDDVKSEYAHSYQVRYDGTAEQHESYGIKEGDYNISDIIDDTGIDPKYCPYCSGDAYTDNDLLSLALHLLGISKDRIIALYKEKHNK